MVLAFAVQPFLFPRGKERAAAKREDLAKSDPTCFAEDQVLELTGTIRHKVFPGVTEFSSIENGDVPEGLAMLQLDKRLCRDVNFESPCGQLRHPNYVGLVAADSLRSSAGFQGFETDKQAKVEGKVWCAVTGHHHLDVLMTVEKLLEP